MENAPSSMSASLSLNTAKHFSLTAEPLPPLPLTLSKLNMKSLNTALAELDGWGQSSDSKDNPSLWRKSFPAGELLTSEDGLPTYLTPSELRDRLVTALESLNYLHAASLVRYYPLTK